MHRRNGRTSARNFSLIELLIVIGILGALLTLVLPSFNNTTTEAKDTVALAEMKDIQSAFRRFASDVIFREDQSGNGNKYLYDIGKYGLWPLMIDEHPVESEQAGIEYQDYDPEAGIGRRGPYLNEEGYLKIIANPAITGSGQYGQPKDGSGAGSVPVIKDPYGGYYRVLVPVANSGGDDLSLFKRLQKMVLVCTGPNGQLDTTPTSFYTAGEDGSHQNKVNDLKAEGDDIVIRLMPLAGY